MSNVNALRTGTVQRWRRPATFLVGAVVLGALAFPALAAVPSPDPSASAVASPVASEAASTAPSVTPVPTAAPTAAPAATPRSVSTPPPVPAKPDKATKPDKANKVPAVAITLRGTVARATDAKGRPAFSLSSGGTTYELSAGPSWFWGADSPLAPFAGKTVTIAGETRPGTTEVDVQTVDGTAIRAAGKPPWAGGWKVVGEKHPGWSQAKADKFKAKFGDCFPPGKCKRPDTTPNTGPLGD